MDEQHSHGTAGGRLYPTPREIKEWLGITPYVPPSRLSREEKEERIDRALQALWPPQEMRSRGPADRSTASITLWVEEGRKTLAAFASEFRDGYEGQREDYAHDCRVLLVRETEGGASAVLQAFLADLVAGATPPDSAPVPLRGDDQPPRTDPASDGRQVCVGEANKRAMRLAKELRAAFFVLSDRKIAKRIGCHVDTWKKTAFYEKSKNRLAGRRKAKRGQRKATGLGEQADNVTARLSEQARNHARREAMDDDPDECERKKYELDTLIAEQEADQELSPLDPDPPGKPRKVRSHKRA